MNEDQAQVKVLQERLARLRIELQEFIYVEEVLVAARLVSQDKIKQAHELVQSLKLAEGKADQS